jgi:hypothetical protein
MLRDAPAVYHAAYGIPAAASMSRAGSSIGMGRGLASERPDTTSILMKPSPSYNETRSAKESTNNPTHPTLCCMSRAN